MKQGFTLIELLIVVAIVGIIGGMVSIRVLQVNQATAVENSILTLSSYLKDARSRTLSGQTSGSASSWGVYVDPTTLAQPLVFADVDADGVYSVGDVTEEIFLDENTQVSACRINATDVPDCGVLFTSPSAEASVFSLGASPAAPLTSLEVDVQSISDTSLVETVFLTAPSGLVTTSITL
jgi:prepilin-type N-terminal cleavage/methylation domain-containing protein